MEFVEGEEYDYRIMSRMNFVDLVGSERCVAVYICGERLKVDVVFVRFGEICFLVLFLGDYKVYRFS